MDARGFHLKTLIIGGALLLAVAALSMSIGPQGSFLKEIASFSLTEEQSFVLFQLRVPRFLLAFAVGSLLSLSGLTYQTLFSNPIASPYTLGVSGGAAVGFVLSQNFFQGALPPSYSWIFAALGGALTLLALLPLLFVRSNDYAKTVLLIGVLVSLFSGSLLFFLQYFLDPAGLIELTGWYFGSLNVVGLLAPGILFFVSVFFYALLTSCASSMDLLMCGRDYARSQGVETKQLEIGLIGITTLCIALTVSLCGPIGFLGLVIPHFARALFGHSHNRIIPITFFSGGLFLVLSDVFARVIGGNQEIPVGLMTALVGCPIMMALLIRGVRKG